MVGLLGVLAAGAAQGYGATKNAEVNMHNAAVIENNREMLRQQFEEQRFNRQLQASREAAIMNAEFENAKYHRDRSDKLADEEMKHNREMQKYGLLEEGRNKRNASSNAARMKAAEMRSQGGGLLDSSGGGKAQSTVGKTIQDLMNLGLASNPQEAYNLYEESGLAKMLASSPMVMRPEQIIDYIRMWRGQRQSGGMNGGANQVADFVFNPETGKLEPSQ